MKRLIAACDGEVVARRRDRDCPALLGFNWGRRPKAPPSPALSPLIARPDRPNAELQSPPPASATRDCSVTCLRSGADIRSSVSCPQFISADIRSSATQLVFLGNPLVLFVQISDPILKTGRRRPVEDVLLSCRRRAERPSRARLVDKSQPGRCEICGLASSRTPASGPHIGPATADHDGQIGFNHLTFRLTAEVLPRLSSSSNSRC